MLSSGKPKIFFKCKLLDVDGFRYGKDWFMGDRVVAKMFGKFFEGIIRSVSVMVNPNGEETVTAKLESEGLVL